MATLLLSVLITVAGCGGGSNSTSATSSISGNWQLSMVRHNSTEAWTFSGFLLQSGSSVTGSFILGAGVGCQGGAGQVSGTFDGKTLQLTIGSFGQDFSLTGGMASGTSTTPSLQGQFSTLSGACLGFSSTGTWSAVLIKPLTTSFHASFVPAGVNPVPITATGTLTQGANVGASNATLLGTIAPTGSQQFCSYIATGTSITGTISGTSVVLNFYAPDGSQIGQLPAFGFPPATLAANGKSLTGDYSLQGNSAACPGNNGAVTLTFP